MKYKKIPAEDRFWKKVDKSGDCWEWKASKTELGYGQFYPEHGSPVKAHRYSYSISVGDIPINMCVCHTCDNPGCVNPGHLWVGSITDNAQDKVRKGRSFTGDHKGEKNKNAKLKSNDVLEIRRLYDSGKFTKELLSKMFLLSSGHVCNIINRKAWRNI
jgi:hypothetical protein